MILQSVLARLWVSGRWAHVSVKLLHFMHHLSPEFVITMVESPILDPTWLAHHSNSTVTTPVSNFIGNVTNQNVWGCIQDTIVLWGKTWFGGHCILLQVHLILTHNMPWKQFDQLITCCSVCHMTCHKVITLPQQ